MSRKKEAFIKIGIYALIVVIIFLFQTPRGVLRALRGLGINLVPALIACAAMYEGPIFASVLGFFAGFIFNIGSGAVPGAQAVFYVVFGVVCGILMENYMREIAISPFICSLAGSAASFILSYVFYYGIMYSNTMLYALEKGAVSIAASAVFFPLVYFAVKKVSGGSYD